MYCDGKNYEFLKEFVADKKKSFQNVKEKHNDTTKIFTKTLNVLGYAKTNSFKGIIVITSDETYFFDLDLGSQLKSFD